MGSGFYDNMAKFKDTAAEVLKKQAKELNKANRLYAFISQVNQNIVRVENEQLLFHNACNIALEFGKFKIAWIGLFDLANGTITAVDQMGLPGEDIEKFKNVALKADGPQENILCSGKFFVCNAILKSHELEDWKAIAIKLGIRSCMILPIKKSGNVIGTFNLYAAESDFFNKEEIKLLVEVTEDISFALDLFAKEDAHKQTQELVVQNEKRFRALIEKSPDMITLSTPDGELLYVSSSVKKVLGYSVEDLLHSSVFDIIHPDDIPNAIENKNEILLTPGSSFYYQQRRKHKNDSWIWCEGSLTNMLNEPGINALVSNFRDISEKKITEYQQEFDRNNLDALINNTNDLMWSVDRNARLITFNQPFHETINLATGKVLTKGDDVFSVVLSPQQFDRFKKSYTRAFAGETFTEIEYVATPIESWTEISFYPIRKGNEVIGTACHSHDITERKKAEETLKRAKENLKQSESSLKQAQAIAHIGNFEIDLSNNSEVWSDEMYKINGSKKEDSVPSTELFLSFIHPEDFNYVKTGFDECVKNSKDSSFEFRFIRKDGIMRYGCTEARFEFDGGRHPIRLFGIFQDITERKLAEMERTKMVSDIMQRNTELEQFGYIISHNLRAPVANIIGASEALNDPGLSTEDKEMLNNGINLSVTKLDNVVKDLNHILEVKSEITDTKEIVHFSTLADDIKRSIQNLIDKYNIKINYDFSQINEFLTLRAYLYSIFYNLISNSIKYRRQQIPCIIEIKSNLVKNKLELVFTDNGTGIDLEKNSGDVFGLYKRFHTDIEGKGMGLFMVKTQVETLGGKISVMSAENQGTEFKIEFNI